MPNWCYNNITITGDKNNLENLKMRINLIRQDEHTKERFFESLIGTHPEVSRESYDAGEWYSANINHFGTKWDIGTQNVEVYDDYIQINEETAWSPPIQGCINIALKYGVDIEMYYEEPGSDFCGKTFIDSEGNHTEEDYEYQEGVYKFEGFSEWYEREFSGNLDYYVDCLNDEEMTPTELVSNYCGFLTEEEVKECVKALEEEMQQQQ